MTESERYARQTIVPEVGVAGQRRIAAARVLVVGVGGLGCPAAQSLAAAGVGRMDLVDPDFVEESNLHRQTLYGPLDVGRRKVEAARDALKRLRPDLQIGLHPVALDAANATSLVAAHDVVLDCTDDFAARYALSDACRAARIPLVSASVSRWEAQVIVQIPGGACYRCAYPTPPADAVACAIAGVPGPVPAVAGAVQAVEALKVLLGLPAPRHIALYDGRSGSWSNVQLARRPGCVCTMDSTPIEAPACPLPWATSQTPEISADDYEARKSQFRLLDVRESDEHAEFALPGSVLIPLGQLERRLRELPAAPLMVYCSMGGRSAQATRLLREHGIEAYNLKGGLRSWSARHG